MKEEVRKVIEEERVKPEATYQKPFLILLTGNVGSGKSLVSQILSKEFPLLREWPGAVQTPQQLLSG